MTRASLIKKSANATNDFYWSNAPDTRHRRDLIRGRAGMSKCSPTEFYIVKKSPPLDFSETMRRKVKVMRKTNPL